MSRRGLIREGDVQIREGSSRIGHKDACVRGETGAIPGDHYLYAALDAGVGGTYLTTKDMSDPHFAVIDHIGQMISRELVRLEQYRIGR